MNVITVLLYILYKLYIFSSPQNTKYNIADTLLAIVIQIILALYKMTLYYAVYYTYNMYI